MGFVESLRYSLKYVWPTLEKPSGRHGRISVSLYNQPVKWLHKQKETNHTHFDLFSNKNKMWYAENIVKAANQG